MSATTRLILVRHGESQVTVDRVIGGPRTCSGLSDLGRLQAAALKARFDQAPIEVDHLWASTMPRAIETAEIIAPALGDLAVQIDGDLEEHRPGEADGLPFAEFGDVYEHFDFADQPFRPMAPGAESLAGFHQRAGAAIHQLLEKTAGSTSLVACHGGVVDVAMRSLLSIGLRPTFDLHTLNTSLTEFKRDAGSKRWTLVRYNDSAHLSGLPRATNL